MTGPGGEPLAEAHDLVLRYGGHTALESSSFRLPSGAVTAVVGPNGSGKSTLLSALVGLVVPSSGRLRVLGGDPARRRTRLAYVLQSVSVPTGVPLTVAEVVGMARYPTLGLWRRRRADDQERVDGALRRLDIADLAARHLTELSAGQRQRVYVAQGIAQDHDALLLDEPMTGVDLVSARAIDRLVHAERDAGVSVVLTTHDLDEARAADHVVLTSGRVLAAGPPADVLTPANLAIAYRIGALHPATDGLVVDDPCDP